MHTYIRLAEKRIKFQLSQMIKLGGEHSGSYFRSLTLRCCNYAQFNAFLYRICVCFSETQGTVLTDIYFLGITYYWLHVIDYILKRISAKSRSRSSVRRITIDCNVKVVRKTSIFTLPIWSSQLTCYDQERREEFLCTAISHITLKQRQRDKYISFLLRYFL